VMSAINISVLLIFNSKVVKETEHYLHKSS
jgi:hypothetical protein